MKVYQIPLLPMDANTYVVVDENTKECLLIDLGDEFNKIEKFLQENNLKPLAVLLTHGHFDHIMGTYDAQKYGIPIYISKSDGYMLSDSDNLGEAFGFEVKKVTPDCCFNGGDVLKIGNFTVEVINTCGHTVGSVSFIIGDYLFTGDTLFLDSYGRVDFPTGDYESLYNSIVNNLFLLEKNYIVMPGHGEKTSLYREKKENSILL